MPTPPALRRHPVRAAGADKKYRLLPDSGAFCAEGPKDYLLVVLKQAKNSRSAGSAFHNTALVEGPCAAVNYTTPFTGKCFDNPDAAVFLDNDAKHRLAFMGSSLQAMLPKDTPYSFGEAIDLVANTGSLFSVFTGSFPLGVCHETGTLR